MAFKKFFFGMTVPEREAFAGLAHTSRAFLTRVAYGKPIELGFADVLVALGGGKFSLADLPLTDNAHKQHLIRTSPRAKEIAPTAAANPMRRATDRRDGPDNERSR